MIFKKLSAIATALVFTATFGCGDDKPRRAKQPWAPTQSAAPAAEDVSSHAAAGISTADFDLSLIHAKIAQGVKDPGELQEWIGQTPAVNMGVDKNPTNGSLDAIMVSMEAIGDSQCFLFGAVEETTVDTPFNVGRVCVSTTPEGEVAIQSTYPEHVRGYQDHSYHGHYPRNHFVTGMFAGAALALLLSPGYRYNRGFGGGYWGGGGGWSARPVMSVSQRTTVRNNYITKNNVVSPKVKPRPANTKKSKAAKRTASRFNQNKNGAIAGKPGSNKMGDRKGQGSKFKAGSAKPPRNNNSFLSDKSKAGAGKTPSTTKPGRAAMPAAASVASRRAAGTMPRQGQKPTAKQGGRPVTSKPGGKTPNAKAGGRPTSKKRPASRSRPSSKSRKRK